LYDAGPFVARYTQNDRFLPRFEAFYARIQRTREFGLAYTVPGVVGEAYTLIRREAGLARAREFLADIGPEPGAPIVHPVGWHEVRELLARERPDRLGRSVSFVDASLVVAVRQLGIRHVVTVNHRDFRPFGLTPLP
jgi:predicted nucleic acid-binding protein